MADAVVDLIQDFSARLAAMAGEFGERAQAITRPAATHEPGDPEVLTRRARQLLADRKARRACFPGELFHEPAWDMLIALFIARDDPQPVNVKVLATYADAPVTTAQRWIDHLAKVGLIARRTDPQDRRRVEVSLTDAGLNAMRAYLTALPAAIPREIG